MVSQFRATCRCRRGGERWCALRRLRLRRRRRTSSRRCSADSTRRNGSIATRRRFRCRSPRKASVRAALGARRAAAYGGGQAYCVRTCDGRYFPVTGAGQRRAVRRSCNSFCPASDTKVFYGEQHRQRLRRRQVLFGAAQCVSLSRRDRRRLHLQRQGPVRAWPRSNIDDDPTLRKGDLVASTDGLMVAGRADRRHGELKLSPASASLRARYDRLPVVASE